MGGQLVVVPEGIVTDQESFACWWGYLLVDQDGGGCRCEGFFIVFFYVYEGEVAVFYPVYFVDAGDLVFGVADVFALEDFRCFR